MKTLLALSVISLLSMGGSSLQAKEMHCEKADVSKMQPQEDEAKSESETQVSFRKPESWYDGLGR